MPQNWNEILNPTTEEGDLWELFHENSKTTRFDRPLSNQAVRDRMVSMWSSLPYEGYPDTNLPEPGRLEMALSDAIRRRVTARDLQGCSITLAQLATILFHAYGETRSNKDTGFPRPFRVIPSGGGLYPLEIFFHTCRTEGLQPGLYHYNPNHHKVQLLRAGDFSHQLTSGFVQQELVLNSAVQIFVTALFERSVFKYKDRGYRFVLLEAGHFAQNLNLAATALGFGVINVGGFFDRVLDDFLNLDGISHATIYAQVVGAHGSTPAEITW